MTVTVADITRKRGDTRRITFVITQDGVPLNIAAWSGFRMTIDPSKAPADSSTLVEQLVGEQSTNGADGKMFFISTGTIAPGKYYYDCQALDDNGEKVTFAEGKYTVSQDITKV
jgi:hypothetical protein